MGRALQNEKLPEHSCSLEWSHRTTRDRGGRTRIPRLFTGPTKRERGERRAPLYPQGHATSPVDGVYELGVESELAHVERCGVASSEYEQPNIDT